MDRQVITIRLQVDLFEADGRWRARLPEGPDIEIDGNTREEALAKAQVVGLLTVAGCTECEPVSTRTRIP